MSPENVMGSRERYRDLYEWIAQHHSLIATEHAGNPIRSRVIWETLLPHAKRTRTLLDVGCGEGFYSVPYARAGGIVDGIDISPTRVRQAQEMAARCGEDVEFRTRFYAWDIEDSWHGGEEGWHYDVALFSEVLEHLREPSRAMDAIAAALKPGGTLILSTPLPHNVSAIRFLRRTLDRRMLNEPVLRDMSELADQAPPDVLYRHDGYYPLALKDWVESFGFRCLRFRLLEHRLSMAMPLMSLIGSTNFGIFRREGEP